MPMRITSPQYSLQMAFLGTSWISGTQILTLCNRFLAVTCGACRRLNVEYGSAGDPQHMSMYLKSLPESPSTQVSYQLWVHNFGDPKASPVLSAEYVNIEWTGKQCKVVNDAKSMYLAPLGTHSLVGAAAGHDICL